MKTLGSELISNDAVAVIELVKNAYDAEAKYYVALTPSCDHAQNNAEFVFLAKCKHLASTNPGKNAKASLDAGEDLSGTTTEQLTKFIRDNSSPADRYKYLPGTSFLPDLLVDLQDIMTVAHPTTHGPPLSVGAQQGRAVASNTRGSGHGRSDPSTL